MSRAPRSLLALLLLLVTALTYRSVGEAGYVWDDDDYVAENELLDDARGLALRRTRARRGRIAVRDDAARGLALRWQRAGTRALRRQRIWESIDARRRRCRHLSLREHV